MSWQDAHRYNDIVRRAIADLERTDGELVWRDEYTAVFATPEQLLLALESRWRTMVHAQVEYTWNPNGRVSDEVQKLTAAHSGLMRALARRVSGPDVTRPDVQLVGAA